MPSEEFSTAVRGSGGQPIQTTASGHVQTDNYDYGDGFDFDGTNYPYTVQTDRIIQSLILTHVAEPTTMTVETIHGDVFDVYVPDGLTGSFSDWEIEAVTFYDPDGTGGRISGGWAGE